MTDDEIMQKSKKQRSKPMIRKVIVIVMLLLAITTTVASLRFYVESPASSVFYMMINLVLVSVSSGILIGMKPEIKKQENEDPRMYY